MAVLFLNVNKLNAYVVVAKNENNNDNWAVMLKNK